MQISCGARRSRAAAAEARSFGWAGFWKDAQRSCRLNCTTVKKGVGTPCSHGAGHAVTRAAGRLVRRRPAVGRNGVPVGRRRGPIRLTSPMRDLSAPLLPFPQHSSSPSHTRASSHASAASCRLRTKSRRPHAPAHAACRLPRPVRATERASGDLSLGLPKLAQTTPAGSCGLPHPDLSQRQSPAVTIVLTLCMPLWRCSCRLDHGRSFGLHTVVRHCQP